MSSYPLLILVLVLILEIALAALTALTALDAFICTNLSISDLKAALV